MTDSDAPARTGNVAQVCSGLSTDEQEILDQADRFARRDLYPRAQRAVPASIRHVSGL